MALTFGNTAVGNYVSALRQRSETMLRNYNIQKALKFFDTFSGLRKLQKPNNALGQMFISAGNTLRYI